MSGQPAPRATRSAALVLLVGFQVTLGMWTVTLLLKPAIVTLHLLGGMATLALLAWLALREIDSPVAPASPARGLRRRAALGLAVLAAQIAHGGWVSANNAALACIDFPVCHGRWLPEMDFGHAFHVVRELGVTADGAPLSQEALNAIHWGHRVGATGDRSPISAGLLSGRCGRWRCASRGWCCLRCISPRRGLALPTCSCACRSRWRTTPAPRFC